MLSGADPGAKRQAAQQSARRMQPKGGLARFPVRRTGSGGTMSSLPFRAKAYLKEGCPYSFKFLLFMVEAGLSNQVELLRIEPDTPAFESLKAKIAAARGAPATFPMVEIEPGRYQADSDRLIEHYAARNRIDVGNLQALAFYRKTIFPQLEALHEAKA
jgi:hypothetical protein